MKPITEKNAAYSLAAILFNLIDIGDSDPMTREDADVLDKYVFAIGSLNTELVRNELIKMRERFYK